MKQVGILLIFPFLFSSFCMAEATTFGGTVQISVGGTGPVDTEPVATASPERGEFSGRQFVLGTMNLDGYLNPFGGSVPKLSSYKDGQIRIGGLIDGKPGSASEVYEVFLYERHNDRNLHPSAKTGPKVGEYLMTRKQIEALMGGSTLDRSAEELKNLNNRYTQAQDCSPMLGYASEADYRSDVARSLQRSPQTDIPEENFTPGPRSSDSRPDSPGYSAPPGNAPFATGTSRSVGDGTGIVNSRETDPNASRQTPACNVIRAGTEASDHHPGTGYTKENLMNCIKAIQDYILTDIPQPIPTGNDDRLAELRNTVLSRLFELPNEEQEFAAAIFTLDGEVGHHSRDNPMEGLMVLKTLQNRRDNANGIQDALQACRDNHSDPAERSTCMGEANSDSTFNLLDISLDRMQFSMYNSPELDGNWHVKFGKKEDPQFTDAIDTFFNYKGVEEWTINGNSDASIHEIYHYHTTASRPDWRRDSMQLSISGTHSELGDLDSTGVHVFYENHDARIAGSNRADGWWRNVRHEFRSFPSGD